MLALVASTAGTSTIEPSLIWLRYLGGAGGDDIHRIACDGEGNVWLAGATSDPTTWDHGSATVVQIGPGGGGDAFVARMNPQGDLTLLVLIGGHGGEDALALARGQDGSVIVAGSTDSVDFPTTPGAIQRVLRGANDAFVVKLSSDGDLIWATLVGGTSWDTAFAATATADGSIAVGGSTWSSDFPEVNPVQGPGPPGQYDGFITVLSPGGDQVAFSTHLGGSASDEVRDIALDGQGNIIAVGQTASSDFPVKQAYQELLAGATLCGGDAFVTKLSWPAAQIIFSTYLGGGHEDAAESVAVDSAGQMTIIGTTASADFPWTPDAFLAPLTAFNLFITRMASDGSNVLSSARLPLTATAVGPDCAVAPRGFRVAQDTQGRTWVAGPTWVPTFPVVSPLQADLRGPPDGFLSVLSSDGSQLLFSTYLGGAGSDALRDVAVGPASDVFIAGYTESADLPASQGSYHGAGDVFVARISLAQAPLSAEATASPLSGLAPLNVSFSATATGGTGIYVFDWDFGDGSAHSAEQDPSHTYSVGGNYVATVKVTDSASATASASVAISVTHNCWVACTASVPLATGAGRATSFVGSATPADCSGAVGYLWDFGDGQTSTQQSPSHGYASAGLYAWSLTATVGGASCTRSGTIVVTAAPANFSSLIPALAHKPGFYGSQWRADVTVVNPNDAAANLTLVYSSGSAPVLRTVVLLGHTTVEWADVLVALFDLPEDASTSGVVQVISDVSVASIGRSYNLSDGGTFGGTFPALTAADGLGSGTIGLLPHLKRNAGYRSNVGFANPGTVTSTIRLRLFSAGGVKLGEKTMDVAAGRWTQLDDVFGRLGASDADLAYATVEVLTEGGRVWAYAAVIDNATGDPTVVPVIAP